MDETIACGKVEFELDSEKYEIDLATRTQRNISTGFARPIRPPGRSADLRALQGLWRSSTGMLMKVCGSILTIEDESMNEQLDSFNGQVWWRPSRTASEMKRWCATGSPLLVEWTGGGEFMTWTPVALQEAGSQPKPAKWEWICLGNQGWTDFSPEINLLLCEAAEADSKVKYFVNGDEYEADLHTRTQINLRTKEARAIRPTGDMADMDALQGSCKTDLINFEFAHITKTFVCLDEERSNDLEPQDDGVVMWEFSGPPKWTSKREGVNMVWHRAGSSRMEWMPVPYI